MVENLSEISLDRRGLFITVEGVDGGGKSSIVNNLQAKLNQFLSTCTSRGYKLITTREPGGTPFGITMRNYLLHGNIERDPTVELLLFLAQRVDHSRTIIEPAIKARHIVLSDRYNDSSVVYQVLANQTIDHNNARIALIKAMKFAFEIPDMTFIVDIKPEVAMERLAKKQPDRFEKLGIEFIEKCRDYFLEYARTNTEIKTEYYIINGEDNIESNTAKMLDIIILRLYV